jgi:hypothetical protein
VVDEAGRKVFRRTSAVVYSAIMALTLLGIAFAVTVQSGGRESLVPWAVTVPIAALAIVSGALPKLVTTPSHIEVHNMFTRITVPYPAVAEAVEGRRGVAVRTVTGRAIPVVAFGHSSFADMLTGNAEAHRAVGDVNARVTAGAYRPDDPPPPIERTLKVPVIAALVAVVLFTAVALLLA